MGVSVKYKGNVIAEMTESGTKILKTSGKYCEGDIAIEYDGTGSTEPTEPVEETIKRWNITVSSGKPASGAILTLMTDEWLASKRTNAGLKVIVTPKFTPDNSANSQFLFYNANTPYVTIGTTKYYSFTRMVLSSALSQKSRSIPLSSAVNDVGDMDITTAGDLRVVATSANPMAVGDYTVTAWIDDG